MARKQCEVATLRGDEDMLWRCRINMGYCWFYAGKFKRGRGVVKAVLEEVLKRLSDIDDTLHTDGVDNVPSLQMNINQKNKMCNLTIVKNMCLAALVSLILNVCFC